MLLDREAETRGVAVGATELLALAPLVPLLLALREGSGEPLAAPVAEGGGDAVKSGEAVGGPELGVAVPQGEAV